MLVNVPTLNTASDPIVWRPHPEEEDDIKQKQSFDCGEKMPQTFFFKNR